MAPAALRKNRPAEFGRAVLNCGGNYSAVRSLGDIPAFGLLEPTLKYHIGVFTNADFLSSVRTGIRTGEAVLFPVGEEAL